MSYTVESANGVGEFLRFRRDPLAYLAEAAERGVDIRSLRFGTRQLFQVNHPDLIHDILITNDWNFVKGRGLRASKAVLGDGLLTSEGELHRRQRRLVQPAFHSARLAHYAETIVNAAHNMSTAWLSGNRYAIDQQMMRLTLQIVGETLFSADLQQDSDGIAASLKQALEVFSTLSSPIAQLLPPVFKWAEAKAARSREQLEAVLLSVIEEHRRNPELDDMLAMLMRSQDDAHGGYMSDDLLLSECLTLFLAGNETTANALTWTWYLLAQHPEVFDGVQAELQTILDGRPPQLADLPRLDYTERVFHEALRLYPPAWVIAREAVTAYRLGTVEVPAGSTLIMSPYATQRDRRFWQKPEAFDPDRWLAGPSAGGPRFAFYPFGAGTRVCVGEHFAMMEGILILATLAQSWRLTLVPGQEIGMWPQITLRPRHPIFFSLLRRKAEERERSEAAEVVATAS